MRNYMGIVWSIITFILAVILVYYVFTGAIFIGYGIGGILGFILALLIIFGILEASWFFGGIIGVFIVIFMLDYFIF